MTETAIEVPVPTSIGEVRVPDSRDLRAFLSQVVSPDAWVGTIARLPGLFFTPNPPPRGWYAGAAPGEELTFYGYTAGHRPLRDRAEVPEGWAGLHDVLFVESDSCDLNDQLRRLAAFTYTPTAVVLSGDPRYGMRGRSVHAFWKFQQPMGYAAWRRAQLMLVGLFGGDPCCLCPWQAMRVGGYQDDMRCQTLVSGGPLHQPSWVFDEARTLQGEQAEVKYLLGRRAGGGQSSARKRPLVDYMEDFLRDRGWKLHVVSERELWQSPASGELLEVDAAVDEEEDREP